MAAPQDLSHGTVLALAALASIMVPVRLAAISRADGPPPGRER